ncbi:response regulator FixJ [Planctomycetes bacterium MalM25]|nr:response regulator FixJ [Planctomycetes bacterium MalM25]
MQFTPEPAYAAGQETTEPGQLVLLGLDPQQIEAWTGAAQVLGMRCAIALSFDECAAYALGVGPTVYVSTEPCFHPRMVSRAETAFRRTAVIVLSDNPGRPPSWQLIAWDVLPCASTRDSLISPLTVARAEAQRRLAECLLVEDVRRRQAALCDNEQRVLEAICAGRLNKQIASDQGVSVRTVEQRRRRVFEKMGVESAVPLAAKMAVVESLEQQVNHARHALPATPPSVPSPSPPKPKLPPGLFQGGATMASGVTV